MKTVLVTLAQNDKYFTDDILLVDHNDTISHEMSEDNLEKINELLTPKHRDKTILSLGKILEVIEHKGIQDEN